MSDVSTYIAFGLNHHTAPVAVRERFHFSTEQTLNLYRAVSRNGDDSEFMVLTTCNRTEVILHGTDSFARNVLRHMEAESQSWPEEQSFLLTGNEAVRHVIEVTSGLRSQIVGDAQILSQVKEAYRLAADNDVIGSWIHRLMHAGFSAAKRTATETGLGRVGRSAARSAVKQAQERLSSLDRTLDSALVLGAARMGAILLAELNDCDIQRTAISNRTRKRAERLAQKHEADLVEWNARESVLSDFDAVFVATGAPGHVVLSVDGNPDASTLIFDLSVPRNVHPDVAGTAGIELFDIDSLEASIVDGFDGIDPREHARKICDETLLEFQTWMDQHRLLRPAVQALHDTFETIRKRELDNNLHRFNEQEHEEIDRLTRSITQKILAIPIVRLKAIAEEEVEIEEHARILNEVFDRSRCEE